MNYIPKHKEKKITDIEYKYIYDFRKTKENLIFLRNFLKHTEYNKCKFIKHDDYYEIKSKSKVDDYRFLEKIYWKGICICHWEREYEEYLNLDTFNICME